MVWLWHIGCRGVAHGVLVCGTWGSGLWHMGDRLVPQDCLEDKLLEDNLLKDNRVTQDYSRKLEFLISSPISIMQHHGNTTYKKEAS